MQTRLRSYLHLALATAFLFLLCQVVLPRLAELPFLEVVRNNLEEEIDATPYFYTELDDYTQYEKPDRQENVGGHALEVP